MTPPVVLTDRQQEYRSDPSHTYRGPILATMGSVQSLVKVSSVYGMIVKAEQADRLFKAREAFQEADHAFETDSTLETWRTLVKAACYLQACHREFYGTTAPLDPKVTDYIWQSQEADPMEEEKEFYRRQLRKEIEQETDETIRFCLELALSQIDDPLSPWNQE
jgi:hypothetical protein